MALPNFLQPYIASYDVNKLDKEDSGIASELITQVLNLGDEKAVKWVFDNYTLDEIRETVRNPQKGVWNEESLNYWKVILKVEDIANYDQAVMNINPS